MPSRSTAISAVARPAAPRSSDAGLVDEVILHQVPVLLGTGRGFFQELPAHVNLRLLEAIPAPGVTHLHYEVVR